VPQEIKYFFQETFLPDPMAWLYFVAKTVGNVLAAQATIATSQYWIGVHINHISYCQKVLYKNNRVLKLTASLQGTKSIFSVTQPTSYFKYASA